MLATDYLKTRWEHLGYFFKASVVTTVIPVVIWGTSAAEAATLCALRALHTLISLNSAARSKRWELTKIHGWDAIATGALSLVSFVPIYGTYKSYEAVFKMASNHIFNTNLLRELQQKANAKQADGLYKELLAWEPNVAQLIQFATQTETPSQEDIAQTANQLRGSLIGRSWIYTTSYHLIDGSCRVVRICAIRIGRLTSTLFKMLNPLHVLRLVEKTLKIVIKATMQEATLARDLVGQPRHLRVSKQYTRELSHDDILLMLQTCETKEGYQALRETLSRLPNARKFAIQNDLAYTNGDAPLPEGAPNVYYHRVAMLAKACGCPKAIRADYILKEKYFDRIFCCLENFDISWLKNLAKNMSIEEKQKLILGLSTRLPKLRTAHLDMEGVDARWQMLIAVNLAQHAPNLNDVTFAHADLRTIDIMRRFTGWRCKITNLT